MYARTVDQAAARIRALRHEAWGDLGLAALTFGLAIVASHTRSELALPLLLGALVVAALGARATWRRWDLIERLAGDGDAHVIEEVRAYASQQATMARRRSFAFVIRSYLPRPGMPTGARLAAVADELEALASELDDDTLALRPVSAVACLRLVSDVVGSPLLNPALPAEDLRARVCQIRSGFQPHALTASADPDSAPRPVVAAGT